MLKLEKDKRAKLYLTTKEALNDYHALSFLRAKSIGFHCKVTMADVRSLLKNERAARRIQHKYAHYSSMGALSCSACLLQLKSDSLWAGHLRSPGHIMRVQKLEEEKATEEPSPELSNTGTTAKKRKASDDEDEDELARKRSRPINGTPAGFSNASQPPSEARPVLPSPTTEIQMPSRPATPSKTIPDVPKRPEVNEDEWAAFEADIAAAATPQVGGDAIISAPAMTAAEIAQKSAEESNAIKRERQQAELEGEKEDAARKLEEQLEEMESLEQRVQRLRQKREELRKKESIIGINANELSKAPQANLDPQSEGSEDEEDDDEWDGFRMR